MKITLRTSLKTIIISLIAIIFSVVATIAVTEIIRFMTRDELKALKGTTGFAGVENLPEMPYTPIEKSKTTPVPQAGTLLGFLPPEIPDVPAPDNSKKANNSVDNLLFAMSFYYHVSPDKELISSVVGWDPDSGYYLPDESYPEMTISRNVRYLLILTLYQKLYPTTKYFDDEAARMKILVEKQITDENFDILLSQTTLAAQRIPDNLFHDLLELSKLTGDSVYRDAFLKIGKTLSGYTTAQALLIKRDRDRTDKINMFGHAAIGYIMGQETGNIDLTNDSQLLMDELIEQLWADKFGLIYTNATTGQLGSITETFITSDQMEALTNITRFAQASGSEELPEKVHSILKTMSDGTSPIFDFQKYGFFRRYNGKSQTAHEDYKLAEDQIKYLEAWIRLNILKNGEYDMVLDNEYDGYEMLIYDDTKNAIYLTYEVDWKPRAEQNGKPIVSVDAILDFILITLEDRRFAAERAAKI